MDLYKNRRRFTVFTFVIAIVLLAWGAFVTSINAGLAVPDWPTSFNSYDPFNPWPNWWTITPILAEHGHRLLGALIGLFTIALAIWTWLKDSRTWMKRLAAAALALVILQGVLGGLRVVLVSLNLAVVHASVAQLFFALLAAMALFLTPSWLNAGPESITEEKAAKLSKIMIWTPLVVYLQIFLGALLRHPGTGISPLLVGFHLGWAFVATSMISLFWVKVRESFEKNSLVRQISNFMMGILVVQVTLGLIAYLVLLDESGAILPSNLQVVANSSHMVVGALLFASTVVTSVLCARHRYVLSHLENISPVSFAHESIEDSSY